MELSPDLSGDVSANAIRCLPVEMSGVAKMACSPSSDTGPLIRGISSGGDELSDDSGEGGAVFSEVSEQATVSAANRASRRRAAIARVCRETILWVIILHQEFLPGSPPSYEPNVNAKTVKSGELEVNLSSPPPNSSLLTRKYILDSSTLT